MIQKYIFSYTAATLMLNECISIVAVYLKTKDWAKTKDIVIADNIMQKNSISSRKRVFAELKRRLETLSEEELNIIINGNSSDVRNILFLSILRTYKFIYEFMTEVIFRKVMLFDYKILNSDYESFFDSKKHANTELEEISDTTAYKLKQVLFRILEEALIIDSAKNKNIQKPNLSSLSIELIVKSNAQYLKAFLYTDYEINKFKESYL